MKSVTVLLATIWLAAALEGPNSAPSQKKANDTFSSDSSRDSAGGTLDNTPESVLMKELTIHGSSSDATTLDLTSKPADKAKIFGQIFNGSTPGLISLPGTNSSHPTQLPTGISGFFEQIASAVGSLAGQVAPSVEPTHGTTQEVPTTVSQVNSTSAGKTLIPETPNVSSGESNTSVAENDQPQEDMGQDGGKSTTEGSSFIGTGISSLAPALVSAILTVPGIA